VAAGPIPGVVERLLLARYETGGGTGLVAKAEELFAQQVATWPRMRAGVEALGTARLKALDCGRYTAFLQFNPQRIVSTAARTDAASIRERKCFLCPAHLPDEQRGILYGGDHLLLANPAPILDHHFTIPHVQHLPQALEGSLDVFLGLAADLAPHYTVFYNGPRCGASAPDHLHFQAAPRGSIPAEQLAGLARASDAARTIGAAALRVPEGYDRAVVTLEAEQAAQVGEALRRLLAAARSVLGGIEEPMVNVLAWREGAAFRTVVFFRSKHRPDAYFREGEERIVVSPAAVDIGGLVVTPVEKDFQAIDAPALRGIFREVSLDAGLLRRIVEAA